MPVDRAVLVKDGDAESVGLFGGASEACIDDAIKAGAGHPLARLDPIHARQGHAGIVIFKSIVLEKPPVHPPYTKPARRCEGFGHLRFEMAKDLFMHENRRSPVVLADAVAILKDELELLGIFIRQRCQGPDIGLPEIAEAYHPERTWQEHAGKTRRCFGFTNGPKINLAVGRYPQPAFRVKGGTNSHRPCGDAGERVVSSVRTYARAGANTCAPPAPPGE